VDGSSVYLLIAVDKPITKDSSSMERLITGPDEKFLDGESGSRHHRV
jgi:hypothetical protein